MSFRPLPGVWLTWDASELSPDVFLRYHVYRRRLGETLYRRIARVSTLDLPTYVDYTVPPGVVSEYAVTQVENQGGNDVESNLPEIPVQVDFDFNSAYLHDVSNPLHYVQISPTGLSDGRSTGNVYKQSVGRSTPVAYIGYGQGKTFSIDFAAVWQESGGSMSRELWEGLMVLVDRQETNKSTFMLRQGRGIATYVQIEAASRREDIVLQNGTVQLREVYHAEEML